MLIQTAFENPFFFALICLALIVSLTVHEFAHAWVTDKLGDRTPRMQGRVTLNPLAHLDPLGTLAILLLGFGWGKPVEFDIYNLKHPKRDTALIAFAGPLMNFVFGVLFFLLSVFWSDLSSVFILISYTNFLLGFFNLVPIHPLDGFNVMTGILPYNLAIKWRESADIGIYLLLGFIFLRVGDYTIVPAAQLTINTLSYLTQFIN